MEWHLSTEFDVTNSMALIAQPDDFQGLPIVLVMGDGVGVFVTTRADVRSRQTFIFQGRGDPFMRQPATGKPLPPIQRVGARAGATP